MKKVILAIVSFLAGEIAGTAVVKTLMEKDLNKRNEKANKFKGYYSMLNQWLKLKQDGKLLEDYFVHNGYKTIAIYGMGEMGLRLYGELKGSNKVEIKYAIDQGVALCDEIEILDLEEELPDVDVVVVTATFAYDEIQEQLIKRMDCSIVSLDDVVYEI